MDSRNGEVKMVKIFKELVLTEDTVFDESIEVENSIRCEGTARFSLKVAGDIDAGDIDAGDIDAWNIDAGDIDARNIDAVNIDAGNINARNIDAGDIDARNIDAVNIDAGNINAGNINARNIVCEKRTKQETNSKTKARIFIQEKSKLERKEW